MKVVFEHIDSNIFNVSDIENALREVALKSGVSKNVYNNRAKATPEKVSDFVVAYVEGGIEDMGAYGSGTVVVALFAEDIAGFKNTKKLGLMQDKLMSAMPAEVTIEDKNISKSFIIDTTPMVMGDDADDFGYHARLIEYNIITKVS